jgi:hypothetical protein
MNQSDPYMKTYIIPYLYVVTTVFLKISRPVRNVPVKDNVKI